MRLQFGILWIEDNFSKAEEAALEKAAEIAGFELIIENLKNGDDLEHWADQQQKFHLFDLVLLDLKLANGVMGDQLAPRARALFKFTPILFYSASESEAKLRERMAKNCVEGVFCADRRNFTDRAADVIGNLALSLNRLAGMRGLSMEVVAQADDLCREVVKSIGEAGAAEKICAELDKAVLKSAESAISTFPSLDDLNSRLASRAVDSTKLFNVFRGLLREAIRSTPSGPERDQLMALSAATRTYREDVLKVRNVLGHALENKTDDGWEILDEEGNVFMTVADFPAHRAKFLGNLRSIREIHRLLVVEKA